MLTTTGVFQALGGLLVYSVGPFVSYAGVGYVVVAINVVFVVACWFLPESPMFYVIKGWYLSFSWNQKINIEKIDKILSYKKLQYLFKKKIGLSVDWIVRKQPLE